MSIKRVKTAPIHVREWVKSVIQRSLIEAIALNPNVIFIDGNRTKFTPVEKAEEGMAIIRNEYIMNYQTKQENAHLNVNFEKKSKR